MNRITVEQSEEAIQAFLKATGCTKETRARQYLRVNTTLTSNNVTNPTLDLQANNNNVSNAVGQYLLHYKRSEAVCLMVIYT
jgi:hypothetical protein